MKIGILSRNESLYSTSRLKETGIKRGHEVHIINPLLCCMNITSHHPAIHYKGEQLVGFDAVVPRIGASVTFYGTAVVRQFECQTGQDPHPGKRLIERAMSKVLKIAGKQVASGQRRSINIPVARLYTHTEMTMPVHVLRGKKDGPRLFMCAAIHGDEIIGVETIRRLLKLKILQRLRGTLIAVPVVNVYGFINHTRYLPDRRDLNRFFPGSDKGSLTSRLANIFMEEVVANSTHGIDLHAGSHHRINLPHIRACLGNPETEKLAFAFGAPVILNADLRDGSLRQAVEEEGIPMLLYEAGEALRFDEFAVRAGVRGILAVMRSVGMLTSRSVGTSRIQPMVASSTSWVRAPGSGILRTQIPLGGKIAANQKIGAIADPFDEHETAVISSVAGIVIGRLNLPLVHKGDALFHIAGFDDAVAVSESLEDFKEEIGESLPSLTSG